MGREKFQGEPTYLITDEWRSALRAWFADDQNESIRQVAKRLGVAHTSITGLIDGSTRKSTMVGPLSRITGIPLPAEMDEELADALSSLRSHDPDHYKALKELILKTAAQVRRPRH